jgi:hypothetical protein
MYYMYIHTDVSLNRSIEHVRYAQYNVIQADKLIRVLNLIHRTGTTIEPGIDLPLMFNIQSPLTMTCRTTNHTGDCLAPFRLYEWSDEG